MIVRKAAENTPLTSADVAEIRDMEAIYLTAEDMIEPVDHVAIAKAATDAEVTKAASVGEAFGNALKAVMEPIIESLRKASQPTAPQIAKAKKVVKVPQYDAKGRIERVVETHSEE